MRQQLVDALKTVDTLNPTPVMPDVVLAGSAWPAWAFTVPLNACTDTVTWYVFAALPAGNLQTTAEAADDLVDDIRAALVGVCKLLRWEPWRIPIEPGQQAVPVVRFTLEV